ncbi:hypothetical protein HZY91_01030 [Facklamia sp. DSM 111018]|uniref:Tetratricopeptide repeat protein n=1 Tax=Facklamia lactis TaxID=2749967 RepID=A0ABS0LQ94_9LACT|nr:tetratricopeptide repeat protein [Facklamia lactis]MBG9979846.1 hypothetical protein [Facklamia lactis]MBG9985474.1 hypothetical protein [Facklamia lactis]
MTDISEIIYEIESFSEISDQVAMLEQVVNQALITEEDKEQLLLYFAKQWGKLGYRDLQIHYLVQAYHQHAKANTAYQIAKSFLELNAISEAKNWFQQIDTSDYDYDIWLLAAELSKEEFQIKQALKIYQSLIQKVPEKYQGYEKLAELYDHQKISEKAIYYYEILLDYFGQEDPNLIRKWRTHLLTLYTTEEIIDFQKIEKFIQNNETITMSADDQYLLAYAFYSGKQFHKAIQAGEKAIQMNPDHLEAGFLLLELYATISDPQNFKRILQFLTKAIPIYDDSIKECLEWAEYMKLYTADFIDAITAYLALEDDPSIRYQIIKSILEYHLQTNQLQAAKDVLETYQDEFTHMPNFTYLKGRFYFASKNYSLAIKFFENALDALAEEEDLMDYLFKAYQALGLEHKAQELSEQYPNSLSHEQ